MPREVELKLDTMLAEHGMTQAALAKRVRVSRAMIAAYCSNRWTVLDRTILERIADVLKCDPAALLATNESTFFNSYRNHSSEKPICKYLRRPDAETLVTGRRVGHRDYLAIGRVARLLGDAVEGIVSVEDTASTPAEFNSQIQRDCVVLGSPMVNAASEMAICYAFGEEPFQTELTARLPFHFRVADGPQVKSSLVRTASDGKSGLWLEDGKELIEVDLVPRKEFRQSEMKKGRDCALIIVLNHQIPNSSHYRQLVVLSGFGGVGTEGAAMALVDHFRDLDPRTPEGLVWGAIEVSFDKPEDSETRELLGYKWRYRRGGRCPVALTFGNS